MGIGAGQARRIDAIGVAASFVDSARRMRSPEALRALIGDVARELGFDHFALVHHTDLGALQPGLVRLENYPADWAQSFVEAGLHVIDPVQQASRYTALAFRWRDLPAMLTLSAAQHSMLAESARAGLRAGITVPVHIPGEPSGSCSLVSRRPRAFGREAFAAAQLLGSFGFEAARQLVREERGAAPLRRLTARQRDCLLLAAQGKTDWEIGRILGLSEETVTKYMNAARARYGVSRRVQLAISAIFAGEIAFAEVLPAR